MKTTKSCKHCLQTFEARRSNHIYCTTSCKTKASYKRNEYKYVSGHYQKEKPLSKIEGLSLPVKTDIMDSIKAIENKIDTIQKASKINTASISNTAIGSATADAAIFTAKKLFAPNTLPATKGDVLALKNELNELKRMLEQHATKKLPFY